MRKEAARWLAQGEEDLESAEATLEAGRYYVVSLLAQQAAEKVLKGLYIDLHLAMPPRTHNLMELGEAVGAPQELEGALSELTPVYFTSRYPDAEEGTIPAERFTQGISRQHIELARSIVTWVKQQLNSRS